MKSRRLVVLFLALATTIGSLSAYDPTGQRWTLNRTVPMHLRLGGAVQLTDGSTSYNQVAQNVIATWNQYLVHLKLSGITNSPLPNSNRDLDTSVFFSNTIYGESFGLRTIAVTLLNYRGSTFTDCDVLFNSNERWDSYRGPSLAALDFRRVALHEFGHVLGLDHPDQATPRQNVSAIMNSTVDNIDQLQADDINGARSLYNSGPPYQPARTSNDFTNLSVRAPIGTGTALLVGGFTVQGTQPVTLILRALGRSLILSGIPGAIPDPVLEIYNVANNTLIASNDDWTDGAHAATIASHRLDPINGNESALYVNLQPGTYRAIVRGWQNATGIGVLQIYDLNLQPGRISRFNGRAFVGKNASVMVGGLTVGPGANKEVIIRGIGPSLGFPNRLADPFITVRNFRHTVVDYNNDWGSGSDTAAISAARLQPAHAKESALRAVLAPGTCTATHYGVNGGTGIGYIDIIDRSP